MSLRALCTVLALSAATALGASGTAQAAPGDTVVLHVREALAALPAEAENREGYNRDLFRHWVDADRDGCSTRAEILISEATAPPTVGANCAISGGEWFSPYDDRTVTSARDLDIDHFVPLAESWDSGASAWSASEREAFANDLGDPRSLIAVTASSNRSKSDQDPAEWLPPATAYRCVYASAWVIVKTRWGLSVDPAEKEALEGILAGCPDEEIEVVLAR
ncbi:HNH endonuclease family protein [Streptomyces chilikensis]|uniref:HNH endonuclease family protein n=1 Tax=Streptomyces chilikensis TaxID=1194079 RepID=UPI000AB55980|nr:HNH endonuclease family protein [Streptomyces chilikensis]